VIGGGEGARIGDVDEAADQGAGPRGWTARISRRAHERRAGGKLFWEGSVSRGGRRRGEEAGIPEERALRFARQLARAGGRVIKYFFICLGNCGGRRAGLGLLSRGRTNVSGISF
jgi:hypothetical protein